MRPDVQVDPTSVSALKEVLGDRAAERTRSLRMWLVDLADDRRPGRRKGSRPADLARLRDRVRVVVFAYRIGLATPN
jgi:hypothetical protein